MFLHLLDMSSMQTLMVPWTFFAKVTCWIVQSYKLEGACSPIKNNGRLTKLLVKNPTRHTVRCRACGFSCGRSQISIECNHLERFINNDLSILWNVPFSCSKNPFNIEVGKISILGGIWKWNMDMPELAQQIRI